MLYLQLIRVFSSVSICCSLICQILGGGDGGLRIWSLRGQDLKANAASATLTVDLPLGSGESRTEQAG